MKNYKDSDYAVNKYSENIVYRFANQTIEIKLQDYLNENPDKTEEDFQELKRISDEIYYEQVKKENAQTKLNSSLNQLKDIVIDSNYLLEDEYIEKLDKQYSKKALKALLQSGELTKIQRRRFMKYIFKGYSQRQISKQEGTSVNAVFESIKYANPKLKNFFDL